MTPPPLTLIGAAAERATTEAAGTDWPLFLAVAGLAGAGLVLAHLRWIYVRTTPVEERAFRRLAAVRGVSPRRRRLVRSLAACLDGARPVALLVSDDAMRRAAARFARSGAAYPPGTGPADLAALTAEPASVPRRG